MFKKCKKCNILLNESNKLKSGGLLCKICKGVILKEYNEVHGYIRRGRLKVFPCIMCSRLCKSRINNKIICSQECRFLYYVEKSDKCWSWNGSLDKKGYGQYLYLKRTQRAHRVSYLLFNGEIEEGMGVLHKCDNTICVNPSHLWLGTQKDNMRDMIRKNRAHHPPTYHRSKLSEDDVIEIRKMFSLNICRKVILSIFQVTNCTISSIKNGKSWGHIK